MQKTENLSPEELQQTLEAVREFIRQANQEELSQIRQAVLNAAKENEDRAKKAQLEESRQQGFLEGLHQVYKQFVDNPKKAMSEMLEQTPAPEISAPIVSGLVGCKVSGGNPLGGIAGVFAGIAIVQITKRIGLAKKIEEKLISTGCSPKCAQVATTVIISLVGMLAAQGAQTAYAHVSSVEAGGDHAAGTSHLYQTGHIADTTQAFAHRAGHMTTHMFGNAHSADIREEARNIDTENLSELSDQKLKDVADYLNNKQQEEVAMHKLYEYTHACNEEALKTTLRSYTGEQIKELVDYLREYNGYKTDFSSILWERDEMDCMIGKGFLNHDQWIEYQRLLPSEEQHMSFLLENLGHKLGLWDNKGISQVPHATTHPQPDIHSGAIGAAAGGVVLASGAVAALARRRNPIGHDEDSEPTWEDHPIKEANKTFQGRVKFQGRVGSSLDMRGFPS